MMKKLKINFSMKNGQNFHAYMDGDKEEVFNKIKTNEYSFMDFGDHMINMEEVLAIECSETEINNDDENQQVIIDYTDVF
ncbi:hypothetical protein ACQKD9_05570 [Bacillus paramycoides]|uniref:hypothetical protein n=1 Tax=Bacillus paramycoides TaxID=2026194 RepID=UPI002E242308|nr:hypothetical protein [Bacillus paramycoides]MED0983166.1 hypothetical protein [Bacillus paramycoides]MED1559913.1 hypothetical protein [Bacillus paramycoides]